jgi:cell division protein FtsW (lipid II flippase)
MNTARNRELLALVPASLLLTAGFAAVFIERNDVLSNVSLTYGALFLGLCLAVHIVLRFTLPYADPYLFPLFAVLACFGLVMIYRIDEKLAREQAQWFVIGLGLFAATIILLRDYRAMERYRYTVAAVGIGMLLLPRLPGIGSQVNGAYLGVKAGPLTFQPAEFAKIAIIVFLASYLRDTRQLLVIGARRVAGVTIPPLKHFGPLLIVWGAAMAMLFVIQDLGSSLMFFGGFLAVLYVATNRFSFVAIGLTLFAAGSWVLYHARPTITHRVDAWLHPFGPLYDAPGGSYQIAQSVFAQADGGLFGRGFGQAVLKVGDSPLLPAAQTDLIYSVIVNELGLIGACAVLCTYPLQVFVIVGGVTRVIPLTGVTLPFISYGGSSILANFVLLALLLLISDRARREAIEPR